MKTIEFRQSGINFKVDLPAKINTVLGGSATGKSYFVNSLKKAVTAGLGYTFPVTQSDVNSVDPEIGNIVVIDRADMFDLSSLQMTTDKNTYLLFGRHLPYNVGREVLNFKWEGNSITGGVRT